MLVVLTVFTAHAAAESRSYFVPQYADGMTGEVVAYTLYFDLEAGVDMFSAQNQVLIDPAPDGAAWISGGGHYLLCQYVDPTGPDQYCWETFNTNLECISDGYVWGGVSVPQESKYYDPPGPDPLGWYWVKTSDGLFHGPMTVEMATYEITANGTPGVSRIDHGFNESGPCGSMATMYYGPAGQIPFEHENAVFTHTGPIVTYEKELVSGWNLISLPLTPVDNSTSAVLGNDTVEYDSVYKYNATAKQFECPSTMDPGIGYFVNVTNTSTCTWNYTGTAYTSMNIDLKQGLNCIGWVNTSADLPAAMSSISGNYSYVAGWGADDSKYEVYDANAPAGVPEFIDFTTMERGYGYWITAKEDCTLTVS